MAAESHSYANDFEIFKINFHIAKWNFSSIFFLYRFYILFLSYSHLLCLIWFFLLYCQCVITTCFFAGVLAKTILITYIEI